MVIPFHKQPIYVSPICIEGIENERVKSLKLLGIIVTDKITWNENPTYICSKASKRLYYLKQLRRAGLDSVDLLAFYESVIRSVVEYACPVWHTSLSIADSSRIESIQRRDMKIIEPELGYDAACSKHHLDNIFVRRENCLRNFLHASISHHINYTICYHNRNRIDTLRFHLNYLSRKLTPTGLRNH